MEQLGLNPVLLLAQLISFGALFFVLKKFLYSSIKKALDDRTEKIREITESTILFDKKLQKFEQEKVDFEKKNQEKLQKLILDAQKDAEGMKKEILEEADSRSKKVLEEATRRIEQEKDKATEGLKKEAGKLASALAAKILSEPANSIKVLDASIEELGKITKKK